MNPEQLNEKVHAPSIIRGVPVFFAYRPETEEALTVPRPSTVTPRKSTNNQTVGDLPSVPRIAEGKKAVTSTPALEERPY